MEIFAEEVEKDVGIILRLCGCCEELLMYGNRMRVFHDVLKQFLHTNVEDVLKTANIEDGEDVSKLFEHFTFFLLCGTYDVASGINVGSTFARGIFLQNFVCIFIFVIQDCTRATIRLFQPRVQLSSTRTA